MLRKTLQTLFIIYSAIVFFAGLIITFLLCLLISIGNSIATRKAIFFIINRWAGTTLVLTGAPLKIIGKRVKGRYIVIANHISYLDTVNLYAARLDYFRPLGKVEMSKIPLFGFLYKQAAIMVDRSSPHSRALSIHLMRRFLKKEGNIFIFPEGMFNETGNQLKEFYDGAFRLAIDMQTPVLPVIFPDTLKRWHYGGWKYTPGRNRAIYLEPVKVDGLTMEDLPQLKRQVHKLMEDALIKYRMP